MKNGLNIVLLAAGSSRRFGCDKRRQPLAGSTVLQTSLALALNTGLTVKLVLAGHEQDYQGLTVSLQSHPRLHIIYAEQSGLGMAHSLASGVSQLGDCNGVMVMLADMPWIEPSTLEQLIATFDGRSIVIPDYKGKQGHPVIFPRWCFSALTELTGDGGGKPIIQRHSDMVKLLAVNDANILRDIDTPADIS
jgi:molybdenum cofactor cytidylyltransferase